MSDSMHMPSNVVIAGLGVLAAAVTGIITFFSGRNASVAVLQTALVAGFKELNDQQNQKIADLSSELDRMKRDFTEQVNGLRQELVAEQQRTISLKNLLRRHGISIPRETIHATVFTPYPEVSEEPEPHQPAFDLGAD